MTNIFYWLLRLAKVHGLEGRGENESESKKPQAGAGSLFIANAILWLCKSRQIGKADTFNLIFSLMVNIAISTRVRRCDLHEKMKDKESDSIRESNLFTPNNGPRVAQNLVQHHFA